MKTGSLLLLMLLALVTYNVEGGCAHLRNKREISENTQKLVESGDLRTRIYNDPAPRTTGRGRSSRGRISKQKLKWMQQIIQYIIQNDPEIIPQWVQLSFHICFGSSGCDGCLDFSVRGNEVLEPTYQLALRIKQIIAPRKMSNADFLMLLGTEAAKAGAVNAGGSLNLPFSTGRRDCRYPISGGPPSGNTLDTVSVLKEQFGLSDKGAVALMGAHSLGRARPENTGFSGPWDTTETALDSEYYFALNDPLWRPQRVNNEIAQSTQWNIEEFLMLHADMILLKQFTTSGRFDEPSCGQRNITDCPDQPITAAFTREFKDQEKFHEEFSAAYLKMITKSPYHLRRLEY